MNLTNYKNDLKVYIERNNKKYIFWIVLLFILFWIYSGWNSDNSDLEHYENDFYYFSDGLEGYRISFLHLYIMKFFRGLGFDFETFHILVYGIGMLSICIITYKWTAKPLVCLLIYLLYHFVRDVVELKNFIACFFLFVMLFVAFKTDNKYKSIFLQLILFVAAFSYHISFVAYFYVFFVSIYKRFNALKVIIVSLIAASFGFVLTQVASSMVNVEGLSEKTDSLFDMPPVWSVPLGLCILLMNFYVISYFSKIDFGSYGFSGRSYGQYQIYMYNLNLLSFALLIPSAVSFSFIARLFGNLILLNTFFICNCLVLQKRRDYFGTFIFAIYIFIVAFFTSMESGHYEGILFNNSLLK